MKGHMIYHYSAKSTISGLKCRIKCKVCLILNGKMLLSPTILYEVTYDVQAGLQTATSGVARRKYCCTDVHLAPNMKCRPRLAL